MAAGNAAGVHGMQRNGGNQAVEQVLKILRAQPRSQGWQSRVSAEERTKKIWELVTSLRLIKTDMNLPQAVQVAMKFEQTEFEQSPDQATYEAKCREKLGQVRDAREKHAASIQQHLNAQNAQNAQMGLMQQQNSMQGMMLGQTQNQAQQNFPHHLQHQMQASPIPMQQQQSQMTTGIESQTLQAPTQPRQVFPPNGQPPPQQRPPNQGPFTAQENVEINLMAHQMAKNMSQEELQKIRANLQNITLEQRDSLARQNLDPLTYFFRSQAARQFKMRKANPQAQYNAQQQNRALGAMAGGAPGQQRQLSQNPAMSQGQQPGGAPGNTNFDQWMGNVENFVGQQADALRASEAGQLVVPASNSQRSAQQQLGGIPATVPPSQPGQLRPSVPPQGGTQISMAQQQLYSVHQAQQEKINQAAQIEARSQAQARATAAKAQQMALQGQPGGMTPHLGQRPPQQSPAMPMLNRPLGPSGQQPPNQSTPQQPSQQSTPQMGQQPGQPLDPRFAPQLAQQTPQGRGPATQPDGGIPRPSQPIQLPEALKQQLQRLPPEQREPAFRHWQQQQQQRAAHARQQAAQNAAQQGIPASSMAPQTQIPHPGQQMPQQGMQPGLSANGQLVGGPNPNFPQRPPSAQQSMMHGIPNQPQPQPTPQQRAQQPQPPQQPNQFQQQQQLMIRQQQQNRQQAQAAMQYMTPERVAEMDGKEFPKNILNAQNPVSQPPDNVKTWGQLKAWVSQSPQQVQQGRLEQLKNLQGLHWKQRQQLGLPAQIPPATAPLNHLMGQAPPAQMVPQGIAAQVAPMGQPPLGQLFPQQQQQQLPPGINLTQPTDQDVLNVRPQLPPSHRHMTDTQVKAMHWDNKQRKAKAAMTALAANNAQAQQLNSQQAAQLAQLQKVQLQQGQHLPQQRQMNQGVKAPTNAQQQQQPQPQPQQRPVQQPPPTPDTKPGKPPAAGKQGRPVQQSRAPAAPQPATQLPKGTKRPSSDDVVEVPDPGLQKVQQSAPTNLPTHNAKNTQNSQQRLANVQLTAQQLAVMTPQQRAQFEQQRRNLIASSANGQQQQQQQADSAAGLAANKLLEPAESARRDARLKEIIQEVLQTDPKRQIIRMSAEEKELMCQRLRHSHNQQMVRRVEQSVPIFFRLTGNERMTKDLIKTRLSLVHQYKDKECNPADNFTMTLAELDATILKMQQYFSWVMDQMKRLRSGTLNQARPEAPQQEQPQPTIADAQTNQPTAPQQARGSMHPLNAENLHTQQEALQAARRTPMQRYNSREQHAPAAPTSARPPFPLGASSPHGVPQAYGPNEMTQDKLKIPVSKRRKPNQQGSAASTPANALGTPGSTASPQIGKLGSPDLKRQQAPEASKPVVVAPPTFRCPVTECGFSNKGFASQADLLKHKADAHEVKEPPIEDPLQFALDALAEGLALKQDGSRKTPPKEDPKPAAKPVPSTAPQKMQRSSSKLGQQLKQETSSPAPGIGTPMARPPTQNGTKTDSPTSNLLKTPQTTNVKTPGSGASGMKSVLSKPSTQSSDKPSPRPTSEQQQPAPATQWADSSISPTDLIQCFQGLDGLSSLGDFTSMQPLSPAFTPPSEGSKGGSSRSSDISENDQLTINIAGNNAVGSGGWNPFYAYDGGLSGDLEAFGLDEEEVMELGWDCPEGDKIATGLGGEGDGWGTGMGKGGWDPSLFCLEY
ncbi:MAG: hypothetical protein M1836_007477 [Candelina mexicana]|nr:MAG: hypothetical protein M1836_007477 [Candelina mexicana]